MSYNVIKHDNFIGIQSRNANAIATGTAYMTPFPKTGKAVCAPIQGRPDAVEFILDGTPVLEINIRQTRLQNSPTAAPILFSGTRDQFIIEMNDNYLNATSNTLNMGTTTRVYQATDFPTPDANNVITLPSGSHWEIVGTIPQGGTKSIVEMPQGVVFELESNVSIIGFGANTTELRSPISPALRFTPFIKIMGNSELRNITIDAGSRIGAIVRTNDDLTADHEWRYVKFQNGGLPTRGNPNNNVAIGFGQMHDLYAYKCEVSGVIDVAPRPIKTVFNRFTWENCNFNFNSLGNSYVFNINLFSRIGKKMSLINCVGTVDAPNGGFMAYHIPEAFGIAESVEIRGCEIEILNGNALISLPNDSKQFLIKDSEIEGLPNTFVGVAAKTIFTQGSEPVTTLTQNNWVKIQADLSGNVGTGAVQQENKSRLWETIIDNGISYFVYSGEKPRKFCVSFQYSFSAQANKVVNIRAIKGQTDANGNLATASEQFIEQSVGTKATSNGNNRPEQLESKFLESFKKGDYLVFQVINETDNRNVRTSGLSLFTALI